MKLLSFIIVLIALAGTAWWHRHTLYPRMELALLMYGEMGIDISHHQGNIDWQAVRTSDVRFAYMKATEGRDFKDKRFDENWQAARAAGLPVGAYHFFSPCRPGAEQAAHFINIVPNEADQILPHAVDAEQLGPCRYGKLVDDIAREIEIFLNLTEQHYGLRPIIYTDRAFHEAELERKLIGETFWLRSLIYPPSYRKENWAIWQYHNRGTRPGITGPVDLNVVRGTLRDKIVTQNRKR